MTTSSACFICGSPDHKNYQCQFPRTSGSTEVKKTIRKEFRRQNPTQQGRNMNTYLAKQENLAIVLNESLYSPTPVIKKLKNLI
jgi:hypothetical protein